MSTATVDAVLERIRRELDGQEWDADTCSRIAEHLRAAGFVVRDIYDGERPGELVQW